jgi:hypothetical protein
MGIRRGILMGVKKILPMLIMVWLISGCSLELMLPEPKDTVEPQSHSESNNKFENSIDDISMHDSNSEINNNSEEEPDYFSTENESGIDYSQVTPTMEFDYSEVNPEYDLDDSQYQPNSTFTSESDSDDYEFFQSNNFIDSKQPEKENPYRFYSSSTDGYLGQFSRNEYNSERIDVSQFYEDKYTTGGPKLYDSEGNFRGNLNGNRYDSDSVSNPYGRYGSKYSSDSVNNEYGAGSKYSADSPNNPYSQGWSVFNDD